MMMTNIREGKICKGGQNTGPIGKRPKPPRARMVTRFPQMARTLSKFYGEQEPRRPYTIVLLTQLADRVELLEHAVSKLAQYKNLLPESEQTSFETLIETTNH